MAEVRHDRGAWRRALAYDPLRLRTPSRCVLRAVLLKKAASTWPPPSAAQPAMKRRLIMTEIFQGPGSTSDDLVVTTVEEEIRREALRQVESIDYDDDHWRIEPLPTFPAAGDDEPDDGRSGATASTASNLETKEEANRHNN